MIRKYIPNTITSMNLLSGIFGVVAAYEGDFRMALIFVLLSGVFDFFDGLAARLLHATSPIGKELDSLADMVSFGLVPAMTAFTMVRAATDLVWIPYLCWLMAAFAALRLANFNIDERQATSFIGLATPANAIFWTGLAYAEFLFVMQPWVILTLVGVSCILLVCPLPMFSLKFKSLRWSDNAWQYIFLVGAVVLLAVWRLQAFAFIIVWYVLLAIVRQILVSRHINSNCTKKE